MRNSRNFLKAGLGIAFFVAVGCAKPAETTPEQAPTTVEASKAVAVAGDLIPIKMFALPVLPGLEKVKLTSSSPGTPKVAFKVQPRPETRVFKETVIFVAPNSSAGDVTVPIDEAKDAQIFVAGKTSDPAALEAAEKDLAFAAPGGKVLVDARVNKAAKALGAAKLTTAGQVNAFKLEAAAPKGDYTLKVGATAAKTGFALEVRLPQSKLEMALTPSVHQFLTGETATVAIKLADEGKPVTGATLEGYLVEPDGDKGPAVAFREKGNGEYEALVSNLLDEKSLSGVYNIAIRATGSSNGAKFNRFGMTAMGYTVPTAKIFSATAPTTIEENGKIIALETDIVLDVASGDRYEVSAALAAPAADGSERVVVSAQSAEYLDAGRHIIKLRFDAGMAGLSRMDGPYTLRGLHLYSQGRRTMIHHLTRGLDLKSPTITVAQLGPLTAMTPAIDEMIQLGDFDTTK